MNKQKTFFFIRNTEYNLEYSNSSENWKKIMDEKLENDSTKKKTF